MIFLFVLVGVMALLLAWLAFRKLDARGPPGGLSSQAIAAACRREAGEIDVSIKSVMWAVTR